MVRQGPLDGWGVRAVLVAALRKEACVAGVQAVPASVPCSGVLD